MSHNHFILKMLNIKDVIDTLSTNKEKTILIKARLSYPVARCVNCGFDTVLKNGFAKAHIRLDSLNGQRYEMLLHKQRFICKSCHSTFGVTTSLNKPNQTLSCKLKNQIMLLPKEGLNNELIARICHCSAIGELLSNGSNPSIVSPYYQNIFVLMNFVL